ncbi:hypothetical protein psyc5s11_29070 [Clostridium gelidum]|uniref:Uncharacterized protein n=1 Tax=Clostridium gelidum TaxID=704125 RepID=A0ABN6IXH4_9CLOT|nr:hypothetical protein [Clostridium gelidum]BCZ46840.1 hypothetical protein psyc5s11_29070 [Clostridium gelidum]
MNIDELKKLRQQLLNNEIDPFKIGSTLFVNQTKTWQTEEWKEIRGNKIQDKCSQCESIDELRLQHTWKPRSYGIVKNEILAKYKELIQNEYPIDQVVKDDEVQEYFKKEYEPKNREICPKCESTNIRKRTTVQPVYKCQKCNYEFDKPNYKLVPTLIDDRNTSIELATSDKSFMTIQRRIGSERYYNLIQEKYGVELEKETLTIIIDEYIKYLSGEATVTLCKRCGFALLQGKNLCPICKSKYKFIHSDACKECR